MDQTSTCVLLLLSLSATFAKYVYIQQRKTWHDAQRHCRVFHTDLASVSGKYDRWRLRQVTRDLHEYIWIGLVRNWTDHEKWTWSGGAGVSRFFWAPGQPQNRIFEDYGVIFYNRWHDATPNFLNPFFCYRVVVVRERKTWEEALNYCRKHHRDLASVASETEMLLIKKELDKNETTDHVWFGLHFFPGEWLWVDGQPLSYEAWGQEGRPACPAVKQQCAAIQVKGRPGNGTATDPPPVTEAAGVLHSAFPWVNTFGGSDAHAGVNELVWKSHDCEARFHFICY